MYPRSASEASPVRLSSPSGVTDIMYSVFEFSPMILAVRPVVKVASELPLLADQVIKYLLKEIAFPSESDAFQLMSIDDSVAFSNFRNFGWPNTKKCNQFAE